MSRVFVILFLISIIVAQKNNGGDAVKRISSTATSFTEAEVKRGELIEKYSKNVGTLRTVTNRPIDIAQQCHYHYATYKILRRITPIHMMLVLYDDSEKAELERQNRITQQIFANYIERRLFPNLRSQQKVPTIEDILPTTRAPIILNAINNKSTRRNAKNSNNRHFHKRQKSNRNSSSDDNERGDDDDLDPNETIDELFDERDGTTDGEALQSVESKQHDQYYGDDFGNDPAENEIPDTDCPNCVDDSQFSNKWTMPLLKLGEKRYYLGIFFKANWFKATQYCRYHGMHLASISSQEENDRLEKYIRDFGLGHEHFWISGTDLADEGNFFWMANGRPITFTNWNAGEPNNFRYENGEEENCLELWNRDGKGLKWNDSPCSFETYFVCEVQAN